LRTIPKSLDSKADGESLAEGAQRLTEAVEKLRKEVEKKEAERELIQKERVKFLADYCTAETRNRSIRKLSRTSETAV
jgi:hypothetical protein